MPSDSDYLTLTYEHLMNNVDNETRRQYYEGLGFTVTERRTEKTNKFKYYILNNHTNETTATSQHKILEAIDTKKTAIYNNYYSTLKHYMAMNGVRGFGDTVKVTTTREGDKASNFFTVTIVDLMGAKAIYDDNQPPLLEQPQPLSSPTTSIPSVHSITSTGDDEASSDNTGDRD